MDGFLEINPRVAAALAEGAPVVALESTVISHGLPSPHNLETALAFEEIVTKAGGVPATVGIAGGRAVAGLGHDEIVALAARGIGQARGRAGLTLYTINTILRELGTKDSCQVVENTFYM